MKKEIEQPPRVVEIEGMVSIMIPNDHIWKNVEILIVHKSLELF